MKKLIKFERPEEVIDAGNEIRIETEDVVTLPREEYDDLQLKATVLDMCAALMEKGSPSDEYAADRLIRLTYDIRKEDE